MTYSSNSNGNAGIWKRLIFVGSEIENIGNERQWKAICAILKENRELKARVKKLENIGNTNLN